MAHLRRIAPTIRYAIAQDNNHGTSEAAALFIGGTWLALLGEPAGRRWAVRGRRWLEDRAGRLIGVDGSFSQYSLNYHPRKSNQTANNAKNANKMKQLTALSTSPAG